MTGSQLLPGSAAGVPQTIHSPLPTHVEYAVALEGRRGALCYIARLQSEHLRLLAYNILVDTVNLGKPLLALLVGNERRDEGVGHKTVNLLRRHVQRRRDPRECGVHVAAKVCKRHIDESLTA